MADLANRSPFTADFFGRIRHYPDKSVLITCDMVGCRNWAASGKDATEAVDKLVEHIEEVHEEKN